jgi:hypothetical protein
MSKRAMKEGCTYPKPQVSREITVTGLRADRSAPTIENATARPHRASSGPRATYDARTVRGCRDPVFPVPMAISEHDFVASQFIGAGSFRLGLRLVI